MYDIEFVRVIDGNIRSCRLTQHDVLALEGRDGLNDATTRLEEQLKLFGCSGSKMHIDSNNNVLGDRRLILSAYARVSSVLKS